MRAHIDIEVFKARSRRYRSVLHRLDGVDVELEGGSYNKIGGSTGEVPHDIAHLVVEQELGLDFGMGACSLPGACSAARR